MPKIKYIEKKFAQETLNTIAQGNKIIVEYMGEDLDLTLRQLYYQFVSRDLIANKQSEYKRLGSIISDARLAGLLDWSAIKDRTRKLEKNSHWRDPGQIIESAAYSFRLDHWRGQPYRVEVWIEKEALIGVIESTCEDLDVPYFACKGYNSQSEMWRAARRMRDHMDNDQQPVVIHLGDHDPSGIDMTRDIQDRYAIFGADVSVERIALNYDQIEQYEPPPNPTKLTDTRAPGYVEKYGDSSWELDALEPRVIRDLIREKIESYIDQEIMNTTMAKEEEYKEILNNLVDTWDEK